MKEESKNAKKRKVENENENKMADEIEDFQMTEEFKTICIAGDHLKYAEFVAQLAFKWCYGFGIGLEKSESRKKFLSYLVTNEAYKCAERILEFVSCIKADKLIEDMMYECRHQRAFGFESDDRPEISVFDCTISRMLRRNL